MTLVISLISPEHVIQVSDRKLVLQGSDGSLRSREGEFNKAVLYCKRMAFSYCGLAEAGPLRRRTDLWLADELSGLGDVDQGELLRGLADRATARFAEPAIRRLPTTLRRHAFAAVGWARFGGVDPFQPYLAVVSNFHAVQNGERVELGKALPRFSVAAIHRLTDPATFMFWIGASLNESERARLNRLQGIAADAPDYADRAVDALVHAVRSVASRTDTVGQGLLVNVLPRDSIRLESERIILAGGPTPGEQTFLYVPPGDDRGEVFGPTYTCDGTQMTNFRAWAPTP